jgi:hydrogenase expression/formation protein HypC
MCLAIPAQITELDSATEQAIVNVGGVSKTISLALIDDAVVGDYVLVHVGYALNIISLDEAQETLRLMEEMGLF